MAHRGSSRLMRMCSATSNDHGWCYKTPKPTMHMDLHQQPPTSTCKLSQPVAPFWCQQAVLQHTLNPQTHTLAKTLTCNAASQWVQQAAHVLHHTLQTTYRFVAYART
jgi:hypothetical protein